MMYLYVNWRFFPNNYRKLLKEDQLEAGTKAAQQEEMDRRKRLEQQRKDFPTAPAIPDSQLGHCDISVL